MKPETALRAFFTGLALIAITLVTFGVLQARGGGEDSNQDLMDAVGCDYGNQAACVRHFERLIEQR